LYEKSRFGAACVVDEQARCERPTCGMNYRLDVPVLQLKFDVFALPADNRSVRPERNQT
jgi:hypothetical protein